MAKIAGLLGDLRNLRFRIAVLLIAVIMLWPAVGVSMSFVLGHRLPEQVLGVWPVSATAQATKANTEIEQMRRRSDLDDARALSIAALQREPVNVQAARNLGLIAALDGLPERERPLFHFAEALSRRDLPTELWMIEDQVRRKNLAGALRHYDRALRTRSSSWAILLPVLAKATAEPLIRDRVASMARTRPPYWIALADTMIEQSSTPDALTNIINALRLDPQIAEERQRLERAMDKLVARGEYRSAFQVYQQARGLRSEGQAPIRDGGFEKEDHLAPFEWRFVQEASLAAVQEQRTRANGQALSLYSSSGRSGEVARQLLVLAPGRYLASLQAGEVPPAQANRPRLTIACSGDGKAVASIVVSPAPAGGKAMRYPFSVPAACPAQWLVVTISSGLDAQESSPWIDSIGIQSDPD